jgi:hypothetical protein
MADVMITLAACDPCYSCTERAMALTDPRGAPLAGVPGLVEASRRKTWELARALGRAPDLDRDRT